MSMQMISDKMHFDTITLRPKTAIWKVEGYNIRSVHVKEIANCALTIVVSLSTMVI